MLCEQTNQRAIQPSGQSAKKDPSKASGAI